MSYDLYNGMPPHVGTDTSVAAAAAIEPDVSRLASQVFAFVKAQGGATCSEVEVALNMSHQTASARIRELVLRDKLEDSEKRRKTTSNRLAIVWVLSDGNAPVVRSSLEEVIDRVEASLKGRAPIMPDDVRELVRVAKRSLRWAKGARIGKGGRCEKKPPSQKPSKLESHRLFD